MESHLLLIVIAVVLVFLNGFFVAAEFGLVKLRHTRVKALAKTLGPLGHILVLVHSKLDSYLSACQLGITLASLGLGWIGEPAFAALLEPLLSFIGIESSILVHNIAFFCAFFTISYLHIVVGELVPKSVALRMPEIVAIWTVIPLYGFYWVMYPGIWVLNKSANWILRIVGLGGLGRHDSHYSADELRLILKNSYGHGKVDRDEWNMLAHTLDFGDLEVADLMRAFRGVIVLSAENTLDQNLDVIAQHRFSRYPYRDKDGEIKGVIHVKDLFIAQRTNKSFQTLDEFVRPIQFVSPNMRAMDLLRSFRKGAPHFAVVGHKGNPPQGFITLDNILGTLVGEIRDEFRQSQNDWMKLDDGTFIGKASLPIFSLERTLGIDIESEEVDSVGGLIMWKLGDVPEEGDKIEFKDFDIVIKKMAGPRIVLVRVYPKTGRVG